MGIRLGGRCIGRVEWLYRDACRPARDRDGKYDTRPWLAFPQHRKTPGALPPSGEAVPYDHRAAEPSNLARARDAPRGVRQFDDLQVAILHHSATRASTRSSDERRGESAVAGLPG